MSLPELSQSIISNPTIVLASVKNVGGESAPSPNDRTTNRALVLIARGF